MMNTIKTIKWRYNLVNGLYWLTVGLSLPLTILLMQKRGISLFEIGLTMGAYSLTIVLFELPTGGLADAIGRKQVALVAHVFMLFSGFFIVCAFSMPVFMAGMMLNGVGRALASGALDAWFVDALQSAEADTPLQPALAQVGTITLLALGVGTLSGGALPQLFPQLAADGTAILTPMATPLVLSIAIKCVVLALIVFLIDEVRPTSSQGNFRQRIAATPSVIWDGIALSWRNPILLQLLGTTLIGGLVLTGLETFWQPHFADLLGDTENTILFGIVMAGNFLVGMVANMLSVPLSRWLNHRYALVSAITRGLQGGSLLLLAAQDGVLGATIFFWLVYLNMGMESSPQATLVNMQISAERRSTMLSVQSLASYLGAFVGSAGLGWIAERSSIAVAWRGAAVILMLSCLLYILIDRRLTNEKAQPIPTHPQNNIG